MINRDLDTGNPVQPAGYRLTDDTYATLLHRLALTPDRTHPSRDQGRHPRLLRRISSLPFATKKLPDVWAEVKKDLTTLQSMPTNTDPIPYPTYGDGDRRYHHPPPPPS